MATSEKNGRMLAAVAASLALSNVSAVNDIEGYVSPKAKFASVENYTYSIDCEVIMNFAGHGGGGSS